VELKHLRNFVVVAELGSVSRAAKRLALAQPPLSNQVKELEQELGVQLLIRHSRGVRLTTAGTAFLNDAKDVLARAESAKQRARHQKDAAGGFVRIGYAPSTGHLLLPLLIRRLRTARPNAKVEVREIMSALQGDALSNNEIDVGLSRLPIDTGDVVIGACVDDPFCLAVPAGHALAVKGSLALRDARHEVFVSPTRPRGPAFFDQSVSLCMEAGFNPNVGYEATTLRGILDLVGAGLGVAIVPASMALLAPAGIVMRPLSEPARTGTIAFVQLRGDPNALTAALAQVATEVFAELGREVSRMLARLR